MSALPDNNPSIPTPATPAAEPTPAEQTEQPRHLHSVTPAETTTEIPVITDDTPDAAPVEAPADGTVDAPSEAPAEATKPSAGQRAKATFTPESGLYTDRPASVKEIWEYGRRGSQAPEAGWARYAATGYAAFAAVNKTVVRTWEWIVDHPARFTVVSVLVVLAAVFPPTRFVLHLLLWLFHEAWLATD